MNLREQLLKEHSKANCDKIVQWIDQDQQRFDQLFKLFVSNEYRLVQHAAWPLSYAVIRHPQLIQKHFSRLVAHLEQEGVHAAVKRNTMRLLQEITIPQAYHGRVMDACFRYISNPGEAAAVKAFALTVLEKLGGQYPAIIPEIKMIIEDCYEREKPSFQSRARKLLQKTSGK